MQMARPPNGFYIIERPGIHETLAGAADTCPWVWPAMANLRERLKIAGHIMGSAIHHEPTERVHVDADPDTNRNRLAVTYRVEGDTLTVLSVKVLVL